MSPHAIESLRADDSRGADFTLSITLAAERGPGPLPAPDAPPFAALEVAAVWRTTRFRAPEATPEGWTPFAISERGLEGLRRPLASLPAPAPGERVTLAIPGLRQVDFGKKRRLRVYLLADGIPVESARLKRKARKPKE